MFKFWKKNGTLVCCKKKSETKNGNFSQKNFKIFDFARKNCNECTTKKLFLRRCATNQKSLDNTVVNQYQSIRTQQQSHYPQS